MTESNQAAMLLDSGVVVDSDGDELGKVGQVFVDNETGKPTWVTVKTGWFGGNESFVPLDNATVNSNQVTVPYDKDKIKGAPNFADDQPLSEQDEDQLYQYYGVGSTAGTAGHTEGAVGGVETDRNVSDRDSDGIRGEGHDTSGPNTDDAMTRSEEQLHVGTEKVQTGRARLRKFVVTEQQTVTVPVTREEVRVVREPITDANRGEATAGGDITEEEHEVVLTEERPVVSKETVPVERVRLGTEQVTEDREVTESVRKEQIEFDDANGTDRPRTTGE